MRAVAPAVVPVVGVLASWSVPCRAKSSVSLPAMRKPEACAAPVDMTNARIGIQASFLLSTDIRALLLSRRAYSRMGRNKPCRAISAPARVCRIIETSSKSHLQVFVFATLCLKIDYESQNLRRKPSLHLHRNHRQNR